MWAQSIQGYPASRYHDTRSDNDSMVCRSRRAKRTVVGSLKRPGPQTRHSYDAARERVFTYKTK